MGIFTPRSAKSASARQRRHVFYAGHVQGVGFRYSARSIAKDFAVTGFVRNLPDGRVELVADGSPQELDRFLAELGQQMADHIHDVRTDIRPAADDLPSFEIRF